MPNLSIYVCIQPPIVRYTHRRLRRPPDLIQERKAEADDAQHKRAEDLVRVPRVLDPAPGEPEDDRRRGRDDKGVSAARIDPSHDPLKDEGRRIGRTTSRAS